MTPGKLMGLRRVTDENGRFKVLALDQSNSFKKFLRAMYEKANGKRDPTGKEIMDVKLEITEALSPFASAVLLDVNFGARQAVNAGALSRGAGLIVRLEVSKDAGLPGEPEPGWSVEKIKKMGAAAVKLLVYLDTEDEKATRRQMDFVQETSRDCAREDILLMTEELSYPRQGEDKKSPAYISRRPQNILTATELIGPHTDVLKLEFPADIKTDDEKKMRASLEMLNQKAQRPWVLLSAGEKFDLFVKQVELAMKSGASGIMAGRAIFQEYFDFSQAQERERFLKTTAVERVKKLTELVDKYATPWMKRYGIARQELSANVPSDWYRDGAAAPLAAPAEVKGEY